MPSPIAPCDQIAFITSPLIQEQFFARFFSVAGIDFNKTDADSTAKRNAMLWERTVQLNRHDSKTYDDLLFSLGSIDIIGQDSHQADEFISEMATHGDLHAAFMFAEFGERQDYRRNARNIAAWLYLQRFNPDGAINIPANIMWENINAKVAILRQESKTYTFFTTDDIVCPDDLADRFCDAYRSLRIGETGNAQYPVKCTMDKPAGGIRLSVSSKKDPTMTVQTSDLPPQGKSTASDAFEVGIDRNADAFCIYIYPLRQYFQTKFLRNSNRADKVAKLLAEICNSKLCNNRGKKYHLQPFQNRKILDKLHIDSLNPDHPNRVWVSALGVERTDSDGNRVSKNHEIEFPYDAAKTIYDNIEAAYTGKLAYQISNIFSIQLSFSLYDFRLNDDQRLFANKPFVKTVTIKPGSCTFNKSFKDVTPELKNLAADCLKNAGLIPLNKDAYNFITGKAK